MLCRAYRTIQQFRHDTRGGVMIVFALSLIPILLMVGTAIDFSATTQTKSRVGHALDSALLTAAKQPLMTDEELKSYLTEQMAAFLGPDNTGWTVASVVQEDGMISAKVTGNQDTKILDAALDKDHIDYAVAAEVVRADSKVELALVMDNTGSMNSRGKIGALRTAASSLVEIMFQGEGAEDNVRVALVPFVTTVNIMNDEFDMDWIDQEGDATWNGWNFEENPGDKVSHLALFEAMADGPRVPNNWEGWKGCVEARAEPYDLSDTAPDSDEPDTLWVPYFWPDEPDFSGYYNNYIDDHRMNGTVWSGGTGEQRQRDEWKYGNIGPYSTGHIDEIPESTRGPNKSCPQPLTSLTNDETKLQAEVTAMRGWYNSGTNIALGMTWGWRALSPTPPFTTGASYDDPEVVKAMVVLTDGSNEVVRQNTHNFSDYTGYGYLSNGRLESTNTGQAADFVDEKVEAICNEIKAKNIRIYTITFQLNDTDTRNLFRQCATEEYMYFDSPSNSDLQRVFQEIAFDLSSLRLAK